MSERALPSQVLLDFSNRKLLSPVPRKLFKSAKLYFTNRELDLLKTAYNVAFQAHKEQTRKDGSAYITHPVLSGNAIENLNKSAIDRLVVSNSIDIGDKSKKCPKIDVFDISPIVAESIKRITTGDSISELFK